MDADRRCPGGGRLATPETLLLLLGFVAIWLGLLLAAGAVQVAVSAWWAIEQARRGRQAGPGCRRWRRAADRNGHWRGAVTQLPEMGSQWEPLLRMLVALLLGAAVGWEREMQRQPAGFRTHALVGLGSAIFTVVSAFAFPGPLSDPTRIAAQIVTGVGFLGRRHPALPRQRPRLTTAASLWAVAAVGMAAGAGLYVVAVGGAALVIMTLEAVRLG